MKILYIINTRMPNQRAHGFQIAKTCEKLASLGNEVSLIHPFRKNDVAEDVFEYYGLQKNFKVETLGSVDFIAVSWLGPLAFYLQSVLFSLFLIFRPFPSDAVVYTRDIFFALIFQLKGNKTVYNVHNWSERRRALSNLLDKRIKVICNSEGTKKKMEENRFKNVVSVPNGVDIEEYDTAETKSEARKKVGLPQEGRIVMYVGNLYEWKGVSTVLETARLMQNENIFLVIVGGDEEDLKVYSKKAAGITNILFTGHKQKKDIPLYLKSSDVLLLPNSAVTEESVSQTSPIKMFEYMASGVPIVASRLPSIGEVLNENNATLVTPDDSLDLVRGIRNVFEDENRAQDKARQALEDVKKYTWDEYARKIMNFINA